MKKPIEYVQAGVGETIQNRWILLEGNNRYEVRRGKVLGVTVVGKKVRAVLNDNQCWVKPKK